MRIHRARASRAAGRRARRSRAVGSSSPERRRSSVDLPAPFGPVEREHLAGRELQVDAVDELSRRRPRTSGPSATQRRGSTPASVRASRPPEQPEEERPAGERRDHAERQLDRRGDRPRDDVGEDDEGGAAERARRAARLRWAGPAASRTRCGTTSPTKATTPADRHGRPCREREATSTSDRATRSVSTPRCAASRSPSVIRSSSRARGTRRRRRSRRTAPSRRRAARSRRRGCRATRRRCRAARRRRPVTSRSPIAAPHDRRHGDARSGSASPSPFGPRSGRARRRASAATTPPDEGGELQAGRARRRSARARSPRRRRATRRSRRRSVPGRRAGSGRPPGAPRRRRRERPPTSAPRSTRGSRIDPEDGVVLRVDGRAGADAEVVRAGSRSRRPGAIRDRADADAEEERRREERDQPGERAPRGRTSRPRDSHHRDVRRRSTIG